MIRVTMFKNGKPDVIRHYADDDDYGVVTELIGSCIGVDNITIHVSLVESHD